MVTVMFIYYGIEILTMSKITINGNTYDYNGGSISIINNKVFVNGERVGLNEENDKINGDCGDISSQVSVHVTGNVNGNVTCGTVCKCGDVKGDINAGTCVKANVIYGNTRAGTSIKTER
jgi:hypothetical protein